MVDKLSLDEQLKYNLMLETGSPVHKNPRNITRGTGVLSDLQIAYLCTNQSKPMIEPFVDHQVKEDERGKVISYGLSAAGYDIRCSNKFLIFTNINSAVIDPKNFPKESFVEHIGDYCIIPPNGFVLTNSMEYFNIPDDIITVCVGKSTLARCGASVICTPFEPGFSGEVVIEIANVTNLPLKIYANEGIAQVLFFRSAMSSHVPYDTTRKYQGQTGIVTPRL